MGDTLDLPPYNLPAVLLWQAGTKAQMSGTRQRRVNLRFAPTGRLWDRKLEGRKWK